MQCEYDNTRKYKQTTVIYRRESVNSAQSNGGKFAKSQTGLNQGTEPISDLKGEVLI